MASKNFLIHLVLYLDCKRSCTAIAELDVIEGDALLVQRITSRTGPSTQRSTAGPGEGIPALKKTSKQDLNAQDVVCLDQEDWKDPGGCNMYARTM